MSNHRTSSQTATVIGPDDSLARATEPRSAISSLVQKALVTSSERQRHRRVLINLLILAQALLVVAAAPGYVGARPGVAALVVVLACLFVCLLAAGFNQLGRDPTRATYVLVVGSGLGVLAQVFLAAVTATPAQAAQAALLLLTVMLEAGLFFAPVVTMLLAGASIALTIVALILAVVLTPSGSGGETYGLIVSTLGLQTVTGLVAWLLAQFIYDSALEAQRSQDAQFAQARLDAVLAQQAERQRQIQELAVNIHRAATRALAGDPRARASALEGELGAITHDVNLLLQRLATAGDGIPEQGAWAGSSASGRLGADDAVSAPPAVPFAAAEPRTVAGAGPVSAEEALPRRMQRVQELAGELAGALAHSQEGLDAAAAATEETQRVAGASVALAHELLASAQQAVELLARTARALTPTAATADDVAGEPVGGASAPGSFLGLGTDLGVAAPGLTGQFQVLPNGELVEASSTGTEAEPSPPAGAPPPASTAGANAPAPDLPELGSALGALREAIAAQERGASTLTQDLGLISRHVRGIDGQVAWVRQAIDAVRRNAERLYLTAGGAAPPPASVDGEGAAALPSAEPPGRGPVTSRPLSDALRKSPDASPSSLRQPPSETGDDGASSEQPL